MIPKTETGLMLNRAFFEGRGDDFLNIFAECVGRQEIAISEEAVVNLLETVRSISHTKARAARFGC
ncbi:hypothetical protein [Mesorhizobium sp. IMUNJ 23232]|uniref:hypothetical protein n=1 Tax=Mesorhizobium sp. IMUNJ 23232 TaxID=3376064 RepID=UPI0037CBB628